MCGKARGLYNKRKAAKDLVAEAEGFIGNGDRTRAKQTLDELHEKHPGFAARPIIQSRVKALREELSKPVSETQNNTGSEWD